MAQFASVVHDGTHVLFTQIWFVGQFAFVVHWPVGGFGTQPPFWQTKPAPHELEVHEP